MHTQVITATFFVSFSSQIVVEQEVEEGSVVVSEGGGGETSAVTEPCEPKERTSHSVLTVHSVTSKNFTHCAADLKPQHLKTCLTSRFPTFQAAYSVSMKSVVHFVLYLNSLFVTTVSIL